MTMPVKIAYNTLVQFFGRFLSGVINLFVIILITREFGKPIWGDYVTVTSYVVMFTLIADFGLNSIFVREVVEAPEKKDHYFRTLLSLRLGLAIIAIFLALALLSFTGHSTTVKLGIIVAVIAILAQSISYTTNAVFQLLLRYDRAQIADIGGNFFLLLLLGALSFSQVSVLVIIGVYLLSNVVKALLGLFFVSGFVKVGLDFDTDYGKTLISLAWPLGLTAIFIQFIANIDKQIIALAAYRPELKTNPQEAVAVYGLAYRAFDFVIAFPAFVVNSVYPSLVSKAKVSQADLSRLSKKVFFVLIGLGIGSLVATLVFSSFLVPIFGDFHESILTLRLLSLGLPFFFVTSLGFCLLLVLKKEVFLPLIYGFAALFNFVANSFFVPKYGYNAAAVITVLSEVLILGMMLVVLSKFWRRGHETS